MKTKKVFIILMLFLVLPTRWGACLEDNKILSNDDYWTKLEEKAQKLYGGLDLSVEVATGLYEDNEYKGEVKIKIPIYSKEEKRKKKENKMKFLDKGAELISELKIKKDKLEILREKEIILKTILLEEGVRSIDAYHDVREEISELRAGIEKVIRKIEVMIK